MEIITLLGASGSIGSSTLEIIRNDSSFRLVAVSVGHNISRLKEILKNFPSVKYVTVQEAEDVKTLKNEFASIEFFSGDKGLLDLIERSKPTMVVNALVGFVGFLPSLYTLEHDIDLSLANKESLVVGGELINKTLKRHPLAHLYPIDSEHVALSKCLRKQPKESVKKLVITASGGPFRDLKLEDLSNVTVEQALHHPSWKMGKKITIDSATMMNKGFEVIEAMHLFHFDLDKISILIQDESTIHSMVEFVDHSFLADIGPADMKVPCAYALYREERNDIPAKELDLDSLCLLHFRKFSIERYPACGLAFKAIRDGGTMPCVLNASNEVAVQAFLNQKIKFLDIVSIIEQVMNQHRIILNPSKEDLIYIDSWARKKTLEVIERR